MKFVTVATRGERYFPCLVDSALRFDCHLNVLGDGMKWGGFAWRLNLIKGFLADQKADEIVVILDAYDVLITRPAAEIEAAFRRLKVPVLFSREDPIKVFDNTISRYVYDRMFPFRAGYELCAGVYMGYASELLRVITAAQVLTPDSNDDQRMFALLTQWQPELFHLDAKSEVMLNVYGNLKCKPGTDWVVGQFTLSAGDRFLKPSLTATSGARPGLIHGPGGANLDLLVEHFKFAKPHPETKPHLGKYLLSATKHYLPYFKRELFAMVLVLTVLIYLLARL